MSAWTRAVELTIMERIEFSSVLWLLVLAFVLHELEEWNITAWEYRNFVEIPAEVTKENGRAWLLFICAVAPVWCGAATLFGDPRLAAFVFLPAVGLALANALQHVFWSMLFRQYAPGVISAVSLLLPLGIYALTRATLEGLAPLWYVLGIGVLIAAIVGHTMLSRRRMTAAIRAIYAVGGWIRRHLITIRAKAGQSMVHRR